MAPQTVTPQQNYLHMKLRESREEVQQLKEELEAKNKAAQDSSTIATADAISPIEDITRFLQEYEPGRDMGQDWYTKRIHYLVDQNNHLTDLLNTHKIPHLNTRK